MTSQHKLLNLSAQSTSTLIHLYVLKLSICTQCNDKMCFMPATMVMLLAEMLNKVVDEVGSWAPPLKPRPLGVWQEPC